MQAAFLDSDHLDHLMMSFVMIDFDYALDYATTMMMMLTMTYRSWMAPFDDFEMDASLIVLMSCVNGIHELSSHYLMQMIRKRTLIGILCIIFLVTVDL